MDGRSILDAVANYYMTAVTVIVGILALVAVGGGLIATGVESAVKTRQRINVALDNYRRHPNGKKESEAGTKPKRERSTSGSARPDREVGVDEAKLQYDTEPTTVADRS